MVSDEIYETILGGPLKKPRDYAIGMGSKQVE